MTDDPMISITTSAIGRSAGILPRWFAYAGFAVGAFLLLSATFTPFLVLLFAAWVLVLRLPHSVPWAGPLGVPRSGFRQPPPPNERRSTR